MSDPSIPNFGSQLTEFDRKLPQFERKSGWRQEYRNESEAKNEIQDVDGKCNQCGNPLTEMTTNDLSTQLMCLVCRDESEATNGNDL